MIYNFILTKVKLRDGKVCYQGLPSWSKYEEIKNGIE